MSLGLEQEPEECALGALVRGVGELAVRAGARAAANDALSFVRQRLPWAAPHTVTGRAFDLALDSYVAHSAAGRLLEAAWRLGCAGQPTRQPVVERMFSPLSVVFQGSASELPLVPLELTEVMFPMLPDNPPRANGTRQSLGELFEGLLRVISEVRPVNAAALLQTLLAALETFAWSVPANGQSDISIFELSRSVSAIASALAAAQPEASDRNYDSTQLMLAVGDLGGIQRFLYGVVASKAARMLRGRSLGLQLIADAIANHVLRYFRLPITNLLYSGGGKLWLLMPAAAQSELLKVAEDIDLELSRLFASRLSFTIGCAIGPVDQLVKGSSRAWEDATRDLARRRRRRFSLMLAAHYDRIFEPFGETDACKVCGVLSADLNPLSSDVDDSQRMACKQCRQFAELGGRVTRAQVVLRLSGAADFHSRQSFAYRPGIGDYHYLLLDDDSRLGDAPAADTIMWLNGPPRSWTSPCGHAIWLAGVSRALGDKDAPLDFDELAKQSEGISRLGILRMDVDSLGRVFSSGFGERATLPHIAALSRHLSYFFGGYLSNLMRRNDLRDKLQIIYSGGDDVFIVGAWSAIPLIAQLIRSDFGRFTGGNPHWGISGGIDLMPASFPISAAAERAEEAETRAKQFHRPGGKDKDALCFLEDLFDWEDFAGLLKAKEQLEELFGGEPPLLPRATLRTLHAIAGEARRAGIFDEQFPLEDASNGVRRGKWAWQAAYAVARASGTHHARLKLYKLYDSLAKRQWNGIRATQPILWMLKPAAEWVDLLNRERQ